MAPGSRRCATRNLKSTCKKLSLNRCLRHPKSPFWQKKKARSGERAFSQVLRSLSVTRHDRSRIGRSAEAIVEADADQVAAVIDLGVERRARCQLRIRARDDVTRRAQIVVQPLELHAPAGGERPLGAEARSPAELRLVGRAIEGDAVRQYLGDRGFAVQITSVLIEPSRCRANVADRRAASGVEQQAGGQEEAGAQTGRGQPVRAGRDRQFGIILIRINNGECVDLRDLGVVAAIRVKSAGSCRRAS